MYLDKGIATGEYTRQLEEAVNQVKASEERRHEYMIARIHEMEIREEGREEGIEQTRVDNIKNLMKALKFTAREAMDALLIPEADQEKYLAKL